MPRPTRGNRYNAGASSMSLSSSSPWLGLATGSCGRIFRTKILAGSVDSAPDRRGFQAASSPIDERRLNAFSSEVETGSRQENASNQGSSERSN
jgi:hypothetical protein